MANRLTKITTRTGDDGTTGLADGTRLSKAHARIDVFGHLDELNAAIGVARTFALPTQIDQALAAVQNQLFDYGSEFAAPGYVALAEPHLAWLDQLIEEWNAALPPLKEFVIPGGVPAAAQLHIARTICRRAERAVVTLSATDAVSEIGRKWLNRLSDVLFIASRITNREAGRAEPTWQRWVPGGSRESSNGGSSCAKL